MKLFRLERFQQNKYNSVLLLNNKLLSFHILHYLTNKIRSLKVWQIVDCHRKILCFLYVLFLYITGQPTVLLTT